MNIEENDFLSFYYAGLNVIEDLPNLYNSSLSPFPFRYFPLSAYLFTPFSLMGLKLGYFVFQIFNFFLNFIIIYLLYKIIQIYTKIPNNSKLNYSLTNFRNLFYQHENDSVLHQIAIFLIMLPQFMNFFLGQINILVSICILSSLYCFLKGTVRNELIGGFLLGFGILIRPTLVIILPFLMILNYNRESKKILFDFKKTLIRLLGPIILLLTSAIYFFIYPQMLSDFININLTGEYTYTTEQGIEINPSFSLTRTVLTLLQLVHVDVNGLIILVIITLVILIPIWILYLQNANQRLSLINGYFTGILVLLIVYFDSWPHHLVVLTPFLIFFILTNKNFKYYKVFKYLHYLIAIFMVIFWALFYLTYAFFPFNAGGLILLILLYYYLIVYYLNQIR
ncbi:MAG: glycosyltransferase 87 family protein [Promethearchaeota archaeon]